MDTAARNKVKDDAVNRPEEPLVKFMNISLWIKESEQHLPLRRAPASGARERGTATAWREAGSWGGSSGCN